MPFQIRSDRKPNSLGLDETVWILRDDRGNGIEVWPALGFNCYRWSLAGASGSKEILYADPDMAREHRPTRSGWPILFPFPNRIRDGRFTWDGKDYRLPLNDPAGKNAIHGFACRTPWRVIAEGTDECSAWITGEYHALLDAPQSRLLWPADHRLRVTYRVTCDALRVEAVVDNPDRVPLPFGLGYHPYFAMPFLSMDGAEIQVPAREYWQLLESLPSGKRCPVDGDRALQVPRPFADLVMDDVLTSLPEQRRADDGFVLRGMIMNRTRSKVPALHMWTSPDFREMVVFTPPHRQAVCLEPYTCVTDAVNLQRQGIDTGWKVLGPGEAWTGVVEMAFALA